MRESDIKIQIMSDHEKSQSTENKNDTKRTRQVFTRVRHQSTISLQCVLQ